MNGPSFVFAPLCAPFMPPLGLPLLSAFLNQHQYDSTIHDLNIELYDRFFQADTVRVALHDVEERYFLLKDSQELDSGQAEEYMELLPIFLTRHRILRDFEESLRLYRRQRNIKNPHDLFCASQVISYTLRAVAFSLGHINPHPRFPYLSIAPHEFLQILEWPTWKDQVKWFTHRILEIARSSQVVGFSLCYPTQLPMTLLGAFLLRKYCPGIRIIMGGPFSTSMVKQVTYNVPRDFLARHRELFDAVIIEDGEYPLMDYLVSLEKKKPTEHPAIILSSQLGLPFPRERRYCTPPPSLLPCFEKMPLHLYLAPRLTLPMLTSRHCYWGKCTFCAHSIGYNTYHRYDAGTILDQLRQVEEKWGECSIYFMDECIPPRNAFSISKGLYKAGSKLKWVTDMRFEPSLSRKRLKELYQGGCRYIAFGLETVNQRINSLMKKNTRKALISRIINDCAREGIHVCLMFFCGFPTETREEALETIHFILDHVKKISAVGMSVFSLCPGTELYENAGKYGIYDIQPDGFFKTTSGMTVEEARNFREEAGKIFSERIYEGHELYHRLFYTLSISEISKSRNTPFPLAIMVRSKVKANWWRMNGIPGRPFNLYPDLAIDTVPFHIESYREDQGLERRKDNRFGMVTFNLEYPLGELCFLEPEIWQVFGGENQLQEKLRNRKNFEFFIDQGILTNAKSAE